MCHRADYHQILWDEAVRLGAQVKLNSFVQNIDFEKTEVHLEDGSVFTGDVIVGADGE
jgi:salicylate hydroxylase